MEANTKSKRALPSLSDLTSTSVVAGDFPQFETLLYLLPSFVSGWDAYSWQLKYKRDGHSINWFITVGGWDSAQASDHHHHGRRAGLYSSFWSMYDSSTVFINVYMYTIPKLKTKKLLIINVSPKRWGFLVLTLRSQTCRCHRTQCSCISAILSLLAPFLPYRLHNQQGWEQKCQQTRGKQSGGWVVQLRPGLQPARPRRRNQEPISG